MKTYQIIENLQNTPGLKDKEQIILDAYYHGNREFFIGAKLAYDALVRFYVQKVPAIADEDIDPDNPGTFTFNDFLLLCGKLRNRELTGHAARDAIVDAANRCHGPTWNFFYRRVLRKDLQCGCTDTLINKALKKLSKDGSDPEAEALIIPVFECQLAKDSKNFPGKLVGKKLVDIKLDGVRILTEMNKGTGLVTQYSREGLPIENFTAITQQLTGLLEFLPESLMLDGEMVGNSFQELMTQVNRESNVNTDNARLALFDIIPLKDFRKGLCPTPQDARHAILTELQISGLLHKYTEGRVYVIPKQEIDFDTEEGQAAFRAFNRQALDLKYEGMMIKDPKAPYKCKRTDYWLKKKPKISVTLEIVGFEIGDPDGKRRDCLGAWICSGFDEDSGKQIKTKVGGGMSDEQLVDFWQRREELVGMLIEVEADGFTKNKDSNDLWSLRFPVFKGFRGRVPGEKL
jgi:DNA ligase-1